MVYLQDGDVVRITKDSVNVWDSEGNKVEREPQKVTWNIEDAEKSGYPHFMLKEIFEQPDNGSDIFGVQVFIGVAGESSGGSHYSERRDSGHPRGREGGEEAGQQDPGHRQR